MRISKTSAKTINPFIFCLNSDHLEKNSNIKILLYRQVNLQALFWTVQVKKSKLGSSH